MRSGDSLALKKRITDTNLTDDKKGKFYEIT